MLEKFQCTKSHMCNLGQMIMIACHCNDLACAVQPVQRVWCWGSKPRGWLKYVTMHVDHKKLVNACGVFIIQGEPSVSSLLIFTLWSQNDVNYFKFRIYIRFSTVKMQLSTKIKGLACLIQISDSEFGLSINYSNP